MKTPPKELTIYFCDKITNWAEIIKKVRDFFPDVPDEKIEATLGIVSVSFKVKE